MNQIIDRLLLLAASIFLIDFGKNLNVYILALLIALTISEFNFAIHNKKFWLCSTIAYILLCAFLPEFICFLPLVLYDSVSRELYVLTAVGVAECLLFILQSRVFPRWYLVFLLLMSVCMAMRTKKASRLYHEFLELKDASKELQLVMGARNWEIQQNQDNQIHMATLQERNRIAREIHDNVGHMLSRSILMVGATIAMNQDDTVKTYLTEIKSTLDDAMNSIRTSVHDLHDEAVDLYTASQQLVNEFMFCPVSLDYDMGNHVDSKVTICFLAIMREALTNVAKHSNATKVEIIMREHPGIYQLMIKDNGTKENLASNEGIGLENMQERVKSFQGTITISKHDGFHIFVMIPKAKKEA